MDNIAISKEAPLYALTVGQFENLLKGSLPEPPKDANNVYGLKGICDLFHITKTTAIEWKRTWLAPAVDQFGRTIVTDKDKAIELFKSMSGKLDGGYLDNE